MLEAQGREGRTSLTARANRTIGMQARRQLP
jgi:hypothetical protein